nr:MAG TPA: hypothetical protein [Caudoviricetes sp.]
MFNTCSGFLIRLSRFPLFVLKLQTTSLRHVQGFPLLGLLRKFRYHIGYSKAFFIAVYSSVPT